MTTKNYLITETVSLYILLSSWFGPVCQGRVVMALLAKTGSHHVILSDPPRQGRVGHVTVRETSSAGGVISPRVIR
jgi:hypothetical protein